MNMLVILRNENVLSNCMNVYARFKQCVFTRQCQVFTKSVENHTPIKGSDTTFDCKVPTLQIEVVYGHIEYVTHVAENGKDDEAGKQARAAVDSSRDHGVPVIKQAFTSNTFNFVELCHLVYCSNNFLNIIDMHQLFMSKL